MINWPKTNLYQNPLSQFMLGDELTGSAIVAHISNCSPC